MAGEISMMVGELTEMDGQMVERTCGGAKVAGLNPASASSSSTIESDEYLIDWINKCS